MSTHILPFDSSEGKALLASTVELASYHWLSPLFQPQAHPATCALACLGLAHRALRGSAYSESEALRAAALIKPRDAILGKMPSVAAGLTLQEFELIAKGTGFQVQLTRCAPSASLADFRQALATTLSTKSGVLFSNFDYQFVLGKGSGHFSPIVAYEPSSDKLLVLDVARHKNTWFWISAEALFQAMQTLDGSDYRGYVILS